MEWNSSLTLKLAVLEKRPAHANLEELTTSLETPALVRLESPAANTDGENPSWTEPLDIDIPRGGHLYIHAVLYDTGWLSSAPLADHIWKLSEVVDLQAQCKLQRSNMKSFNEERAASPVLVARWGDAPAGFLDIVCHIYRAENLPEDDLVVEATIHAGKKGALLAKACTESCRGPHPVFNSAIKLSCEEEEGIELFCTVRTSGMFGGGDEVGTVGPLSQELLVPQEMAQRFDVKTAPGFPVGAKLTLAFGELPVQELIVWAKSAEDVDKAEDSSGLWPYVHVSLKGFDPRSHHDGALISEGRTETLENCFGDPVWKEPAVLSDLVPEPGCFLHMVVRCNRGYLDGYDELAEAVVPLEQALKLSKTPLDQSYPLRLLVPSQRRNPKPSITLAFGQHVKGPGDGASGESHGITNPGDGGAHGSPSTGAQHFTPPSIEGVPHLADVLANHGQEVPDALLPPRPDAGFAAQHFVDTPQIQAELHQLGRRAEERGGCIKGHVPMSFMNSSLNLHAAWLYVPPASNQPRPVLGTATGLQDRQDGDGSAPQLARTRLHDNIGRQRRR